MSSSSSSSSTPRLKVYIYLVFAVKLLYLFYLFQYIYYHHQDRTKHSAATASAEEQASKRDKEFFENLFLTLMALLIIYIFHPFHQDRLRLMYLDNEARTMIFAFGVVIFLTRDWGSIILRFSNMK